MSENTISTNWGDFRLNREPHFPRLPLKAWDAADEYLLNSLPAETTDVTIVNDNFGALTISLNNCLQQSWTDSALMKKALKKNAESNLIDGESLESKLVNLDTQPASPKSIILFKIPKSNRLLQWQLSILSEISPEGTQLWLAGMDKHITKNQFEMVAAYFGEVKALRGVKKARIWQASNDKLSKSPEFYTPGYKIPESDIELVQTPGVFCGDKLDQGSRFFLENFDKLPNANRVLDLGCGNGLLGLSYLRTHPDAEMLMSDESSHAIACAQQNAELVIGEKHSCQFLQADATETLENTSIPLILCNPPFHQGNSINSELALHFFKGANRVLASGGQLWIVANRHLNYFQELKHVFGNCTVQAENKKFIVLSVNK